ncbi:hypothetical protein Taro_036867 [Colocasia esculenta]|uniref:Uncharacterized protein n=1 Tax=Colocasia esculenta TaxID=4460 RepID=A0A843WMY1_COLES|nr:hypothetical protein [Colocasia esculenta]
MGLCGWGQPYRPSRRKGQKASTNLLLFSLSPPCPESYENHHKSTLKFLCLHHATPLEDKLPQQLKPLPPDPPSSCLKSIAIRISLSLSFSSCSASVKATQKPNPSTPLTAMDAETLLIPGLPEEVARECIVRVHRHAFPAARSVCKLWRRELDSPAFHRLRRLVGLARPLIAVAQIERPRGNNASKAIRYCLAFYEPHSGEWSSPPPVPGGRLPLFCQIAGAGRELVVVGGWEPATWIATDSVYIYDVATGEWRRGARMPGPRRSFFACATSPDGRTVYVAGGHDEEKNALRSALAYDVARDEWVRLPDMSVERDECGGVFRRGAFHVIGGYPTDVQGQFVKSSEAFDLASGRWAPTEEHTMGTTGMSPRGVIAGPGGRLFRCAEGHVEVLEREEAEGEGPTWRKVAEIPDSGDGKQVVAPCLVCWPGDANKLTLIGSSRHGGSPPAGYTLELRAGGEVTWAKETAPPEEYAGHVQAACCLEI